MKTEEFENKYVALQAEAKALAAELKPFVKRYKSLCKKASALGHKADNDKKLYRENKELGDNEPDGWNIHVLFRLTDFEDEASFFLQDACVLLLNLADEPFRSKTKKRNPSSQNNQW